MADLLTLLYSIRPAGLQRALARLLHVERRLVRFPAGFSMTLDPLSHLGYPLINGAGFELVLTRVVSKILRPGDVLVDLGAHEGYFSLLAAASCPSATIHSIEPLPASLRWIRSNVESSDLRNVQVHALAIADSNGDRMIVARPHTGSSHLADLGPGAKQALPVPAMTLDTFIRSIGWPRVRFMKIDCEGAELFVFRGADNVLREHLVEFYCVDCHRQFIGLEGCREIDGRLRNAGYVCSSVDGLWIYHRQESATELAHKLGPIVPIPPV